VDTCREVLQREGGLIGLEFGTGMSETAFEYRRRVTARVVAALRDEHAVEALLEGGAAARGRADEYSDIDLMVVAPLECAGQLFARTEEALSDIAPITHVWSIDPPGYPDMAQRFYFLADAPRFFALDCSVLSAAAVANFLERERHGEPIVWLDRRGTSKARPVDEAELAKRRRHLLGQLRGKVPVYAMLVDKELARGHPLEALGFYQVLVRALIDLLGMRYRPERFDFGWRYVERELPEDAQALIARHAFVADAAALAASCTSIVREIDVLLAGLAEPPPTASGPGDRPSP
jgi:predicted nucleotidyltransferase